jgi:thiosulfate dehydrogenase
MKRTIVKKRIGLLLAIAGISLLAVPILVNAQRAMDVQALPGLTTEKQRKDAQSGEILDRESVDVGYRQLNEMIALGDKLWHSRDLPMSGNGQACNMCHADGSVTHPESYPKYKPQLGKVATVQEMMAWCIAIPNQGNPYSLGSKEMTALEAYMNWNNKGQVMEIGSQPQ